MEILKDFNISIDKKSIIRTVSTYYTLHNNAEIDDIYDSLEKLAFKIIRPLGIFKLDNMPSIKPTSILDSCEYIVYCVFTIGDEITDVINRLFTDDQFDRALILDAISTFMLFEISKQLCNKVFEYTSKKNLGLTCRIAPGDGEIDIAFQKNIIMNFNNHEELGIKIVHDYLIKPYKSLSYVFGADKNIEINRHDHKCVDCYNTKCFMRNSNDKIRGPFNNILEG